MRSIVLAAVLAAAISGSAWAQAPAPRTTTTFTVDCRRGAAVTAQERAELEEVALLAARKMTEKAYDDAWTMLTPEVRQRFPYPKFVEVFTPLESGMYLGGAAQVPANMRVASVYAIDVTGTPTDGPAVCLGEDGAPEAEVPLSADADQAHVSVELDAGGRRWNVTLWLVKRHDAWLVHAFYFINITIGGRDAATLRAEAKRARDQDEQLLAAMLYREARKLEYRGDYFRLRRLTDLESEIRTYDATLLDSEYLAVIWDERGVDYGLADSFLAHDPDGSLRAVFMRYITIWPSARSVDAENRTMIRTFIKSFPELERLFTTIQIRAVHPDGETVQATTYRLDRKAFAPEPLAQPKR